MISHDNVAAFRATTPRGPSHKRPNCSTCTSFFVNRLWSLTLGFLIVVHLWPLRWYQSLNLLLLRTEADIALRRRHRGDLVGDSEQIGISTLFLSGPAFGLGSQIPNRHRRPPTPPCSPGPEVRLVNPPRLRRFWAGPCMSASWRTLDMSPCASGCRFGVEPRRRCVGWGRSCSGWWSPLPENPGLPNK